MKQLQIRNAQNVDLLRSDFQHRSEPNFAWRAACSMFLALPALRGFWPMSSIDYTAANRGIDESGQGNHLTDNDTVEFGYDSLAPYVHFTSANTEYLSRADGGAANWADILGTETYIESAYRGLTLGGWFYFDNASGSNEGLISKDTGVVATSSYGLRRNAAGRATFRICNGAAFDTVFGATTTQSAWQFIVGRYIPSTEIKVWLNDDSDTVVVGIPAALNDSATAFEIGALTALGWYMDGRASMAFLCAAQLSDTIILSLYEQTRAMYGV